MRYISRIELSGNLTTLTESSAHSGHAAQSLCAVCLGPAESTTEKVLLSGCKSSVCLRCADSFRAFCARERKPDVAEDSNAQRQTVAKQKQKPPRGSGSSQDKVAIDDALTGVWLNSKSGSRAFSSIAVNACPPGNVSVEGCEGQNAIFINGSYRFQSAWYGLGYLLLIYQGDSFGTILGCLVRNKRMLCSILAPAVQVLVQSKVQCGVQPFEFPREWVSVQTQAPAKPEPRAEAATPHGGGGFGGGGGGAVRFAPAAPQGGGMFGVPQGGGGFGGFGGAAVPPQGGGRFGVGFGAPQGVGGFGGFGGGGVGFPVAPAPRALPLPGVGLFGAPIPRVQPFPAAQPFGEPVGVPDAAVTGTSAAPNPITSDNKVQDLDCSKMSIRAVESQISHRVMSSPVWPSFAVLADVLKKTSAVNKKPLLSHLWRHLVLRCGSPAAALTDFDLIFNLSSQSPGDLKDVEDFADYLSGSLNSALADYIGVIGGLAADDDWSGIPLVVPTSVAVFLQTHNKPLLKFHLHKMYHAVLGALSSRCSGNLARASSLAGHMSIELYIEASAVVGAPFGLDSEDVLLAVNPFDTASAEITSSAVACQWDVAFCNGNNQDGWGQGGMFQFTGSNGVRFPSGPIHCPTAERFGDGLTQKGYLSFDYHMNTNGAWSVGLVPVSSLRTSRYLWNGGLSAIGYTYNYQGATLRAFPQGLVPNAPVNVFVGVDAVAGTCSFYMNGSLLSTDTVPSSIFPCVIAICGHNGRCA